MIIYDVFAGLGGLTAGAVRAGWKVVGAANHWAPAVRTHAANHPDVQHLLQDVRLLNWTTVPDFNGLVAGCACPGHSRAGQVSRSKSEHVAAAHDELRATAWVVVEAAECRLPEFILVENVPEFLQWPLLPAWQQALERLGYVVTYRVLTASRWGVPQRRERMFAIAIRGPRAARISADLTRLLVDDPAVPEPSIRPHIDLDAGKWIPIAKMRRPTAKQLREGKPYARLRAETASTRFKGKACWLQHVTHRGAWGRSLDEPVTTITTAGQHALVRDGMYRLFSVEEYLAAQTLDGYVIPSDIKKTEAITMIGNAVPAELAANIFRAVDQAMAA